MIETKRTSNREHPVSNFHCIGVSQFCVWQIVADVDLDNSQIGICVAGDATRRDLIERLWGRKRSLLRQMNAINESGPFQPVA